MGAASRVWTWTRSQCIPAVLAVLLLAAEAAAPGAAVVLLERALAAIRAGALPLGVIVAFGSTFVAGAVLSLGRTWLTKRIGWALVHRARCDVHEHLLRAQVDSPRALSAVTADLDDLQYGVSAAVTALRNPLMLAALFATAAIAAPRLALLAGAAAVPLALGTWVGGVLLRRAVHRLNRVRGDLVDLTREQLRARVTLQAHVAEAREARQFAGRSAADAGARVLVEVVRRLPSALAQVIAGTAVALLLGTGAWWIQRGDLGLEQLVAFVTALALASGPLRGLAEVVPLAQRARVAADRAGELLGAPVLPERGAFLPAGPLSVDVEALTVRYGDAPALSEVRFSVRPGEWIAIVGATGSGKTTLLRSIVRFVAPSSGSLRVAGQPIVGVSPRSLRERVAFVQQDDRLLERSVADNLRLGAPDAPEEALWRALSLAALDETVGKMGGTAAAIRGDGENLSGGERQRLLLARALLREPGLLLLDEGTGQLDARTSRQLVETLSRLECTRITATHDLALACAADRVLTLAGGRSCELGTHRELLEHPGPYAALWDAREAAQARSPWAEARAEPPARRAQR